MSFTKKKNDFLRLTQVRRSIIFRPLALLLAILLLPAISWLEDGFRLPSGQGGLAFQASGQVVTGSCDPYPVNSLFQNYCAESQFPSRGDLQQFESDSVAVYLLQHNLPATDAHLIYDEGRADLRNEIRAEMLTGLLAIIKKPASQRTAHEQTLYGWFQDSVQQNEIAYYSAALHAYQSWQIDPCDFTLDANIASQYGLSYNGTPYCYSTNQLFGGASVPAESYFLAYGLANSYGKSAQTNPNFAALVVATQANVGEIVGIGGSLAGLLAASVGGSIGVTTATYLAAFAAYDAALSAGVGASAESVALTASSIALFQSGAGAQFLGVAGSVAGPLAIILIAAVIGVTAAMQVFSNQQTINDLNNLQNTLSQVTNNKPDLNGLATDPSGLGLNKLTETLVAHTVPDHPSTMALPLHQNGVDDNIVVTAAGGSAVEGTTMTYQDWQGAQWSAQTYGGWFVQSCLSGTKCPQADSLNASFQYLDWSWTKWTASRVGVNIVSTKATPAGSDVICPADSVTGVSPGTSFTSCRSYVSASIPLKDANGNQVTIALKALPPPPVPPSFTSPGTLNLGPTQTGSFSITAKGNPTPTIALTAGAVLPAGVSFSPGTTPGTASLTYANVAAGSYPVSLTASSSAGNSSQSVTVIVSTALAFTSSSSLQFTAGLPVNFLVTTAGSPTPSLSLVGYNLPSGLTFKDLNNGTALISGTPTSALSGTFCFAMITCGIAAINAAQTVVQPLQVQVLAPPPAQLVTSNASFVAGIPNAFRVTTTSALTPVRFDFSGSGFSAPSWLTFHDSGDGTGILSGTPPNGTEASYKFNLTPQNTPLELAQDIANFELDVTDPPIFTGGTVANFIVGLPGSFEIDTNGVPVTDAGFSFPQGLTFQGGSTATINGTPTPGTGGIQTVPLSASNTYGSASRNLTVNIYEAPKIQSATSATFFTGMPATFVVTTTGYPVISSQPVTMNGLPPTDPTQGEGMHFTVTGLPSDLQYSNLNAQGLATGTLTIQGTPSTADTGLHQIQVTASNGVGAVAQQTLALNIIAITGPAPASGTTCNGNYTGTFKGTLTVSAGQNCTFLGGAITGNITQKGGNLVLSTTTVSGNVQIQGTASFSFTPGTIIDGNLSIQNVASSALTNQICGSKLLGNAQFSSNATPFQLGSASPDSCPGNSIGGNLAVTGNTGATAIFNNSVAKNLSCSSNSSITGGGNAAQRIQGQCSTF